MLLMQIPRYDDKTNIVISPLHSVLKKQLEPLACAHLFSFMIVMKQSICLSHQFWQSWQCTCEGNFLLIV